MESINAIAASFRNAGGDVIGFAPWVWVYEPASNDNGCARVYGFEPTTWTWPQGVTLNFTYGTQSGGVTTDYTTGVTAIASSLGRSMSFANGVYTAVSVRPWPPAFELGAGLVST